MEDVLNGPRSATTLTRDFQVFCGRLGFFGGGGLYPLVIGKYHSSHEEQLSNAFQNSFVRWNGK